MADDAVRMVLDRVLRFKAYMDDQGFAVSRDEVSERLRAIVTGALRPVPNAFVWSREDGDPA